MDQGGIDSSDGHFDGEVFGFGDDFKEDIPFFHGVGSGLASDGLDSSAAWARNFESIEFPLFGQDIVEFFLGVVDIGLGFVDVVLCLEDFLVDFVAFAFEVTFFGVEIVEGFFGTGHASFEFGQFAEFFVFEFEEIDFGDHVDFKVLEPFSFEFGLVEASELVFDISGGFFPCVRCAADLGFGSCDGLLSLYTNRIGLLAVVFEDKAVGTDFVLNGFDGFLSESFGVFGEGFDFHNDFSFFDQGAFAEIEPSRGDDPFGGALDGLASQLRQPSGDLAIASDRL